MRATVSSINGSQISVNLEFQDLTKNRKIEWVTVELSESDFDDEKSSRNANLQQINVTICCSIQDPERDSQEEVSLSESLEAGDSSASSSAQIDSPAAKPDRIKGSVYKIISIGKIKYSELRSPAFYFIMMNRTERMRGVVFGPRCLEIHEQLQVGGIYCLKNTTLARADPAFGYGGYEVQITSDSTIRPILDEKLRTMEIPYKFIDYNNLIKAGHGTFIDFIGVVAHSGQVERTRKGDSVFRRLILLDENRNQISVFLWNEFARNSHDLIEGEVLILENAKINHYKQDKLLIEIQVFVICSSGLIRASTHPRYVKFLQLRQNLNLKSFKNR